MQTTSKTCLNHSKNCNITVNIVNYTPKSIVSPPRRVAQSEINRCTVDNLTLIPIVEAKAMVATHTHTQVQQVKMKSSTTLNIRMMKNE